MKRRAVGEEHQAKAILDLNTIELSNGSPRASSEANEEVIVPQDSKQIILPYETVSIKQALAVVIPEVESALIKRALELTGNNRTRAAKLLEISHRSLLYKLKSYNCG